MAETYLPIGNAVIGKNQERGGNTHYYFILVSSNGETIAQSETYTQKHNAKEVLEKYFPEFEVKDATGE